MGEILPRIYLVRHGETAWALTGQHTGRTDIPLTPSGERNSILLGERLKGMTFASVYTSPLQRATKTCELAGFGAMAQKDPDLMEWNYGDCEGRTTAEVQKDCPGWSIYNNGCPGGETINDVAVRADRVIARLRAKNEDKVLMFAHGHFLCVFAARWLGLEPIYGRFFTLRPTSLSMLGYGRDVDAPLIRLWNDEGHIGDY